MNVRTRYVGGPLDGRVDLLPANHDGPAPRIILGGVDLDELVAAHRDGTDPDVAFTRDPTGEYRWSAHVAPPDGEAFDEYLWRDLRH